LNGITKSLNVLKPLRIAQALFFLNAAIWLVFGITSLGRITNDSPSGQITALVVGILMFGNAAAMLLSGLLIGKGKRRYYFLAAAVLTINIILTFTDQVGLLDWITLAIDLALAGFLFAAWKTSR
jgi:hypothetical protein